MTPTAICNNCGTPSYEDPPLVCFNCQTMNKGPLLVTHSETQCSGEFCCIHNPSGHHMRTWPLNWRDDTGVMERICPHGVGHPDPDDAAHNIRVGKKWKTVHGCDGCCKPPSV